MILNSGLDAACQTAAAPGAGTAPNQAYPDFGGFVRYAAFGTGSVAPSVTDTSLGSQVGSRSDSRGGFANAVSAGRDGTNNVLWHEATFTRVFSVASNVNATEWGLSAASTGNLSVRELFRADPNDNSSSPITLTLEGGDELQLVVTLRVQADWEYASKSFVIAGTAGNDTAGTHDGQATVTSGSGSTTAAIRNALQVVWPGGVSSGTHASVRWCNADQTSRTKSQDLTSWSNAQALTAAGYSPGDYFRDTTVTWGTSEANGNHYAWEVTPSADLNGYRFVLTDPASLVKLSTHKLTLTVRLTIARL